MKKGIILILLISIFLTTILISLVFALTKDDIQGLGKKLENKELPSYAKTILGNQNINLNVRLDNGESVVLGVEINNGKFKQNDKPFTKPTLTINVNEKDIQNIINSKDPSNELVKGIQTNKISYKPIGIANKFKFGIIKSVSNSFSKFLIKSNDLSASLYDSVDWGFDTYGGGWTATGNAFKIPAEVGNWGISKGAIGNGWVRSAGVKTGDGRDSFTGNLTSNYFALNSDYINFLLGGGRIDGIRVELLYYDNVIRTAYPLKNSDEMSRLSWNVKGYNSYFYNRNESHFRIRLVDETGGSWGHLNFDDVTFTEKSQGFLADAILFNSWNENSGYSVIITNPGFSYSTTLGYGKQAIWSPDYKKIAYTEFLDKNALNPYGIFVADFNNISKEPVMVGPQGSQVPEYSPDGTKLTYVNMGSIPKEDGGTLTTSFIFIMNSDGTNQAQLYRATPEKYSWSQDGKELYYSRYGNELLNEERETNIYIGNTNGTGERKLLPGSCPIISPDGTKLAYINSEGYLSLAPLDFSFIVTPNLGETRIYCSISWSPDSSKVAISSGGTIYVFNWDGTGEINLMGGENPTWSPNSKQVFANNGNRKAIIFDELDSPEDYATISLDGENLQIWPLGGIKEITKENR